MKLKLLFIFTAVSLVSLLFSSNAQAEDLTDWIIRDFQSEITVNQDSSLDIVEKITADCGNLSGKHGIFRTIPYLSYGKNNKKFRTPIVLNSITDDNRQALVFEEKNDRSDHTITWKIGDPNKEVKGVNHYVVKYHVSNAIRQDSPEVDELYWNLNGNFWEIPIEKYRATILFPGELPLSSQQTNLYAGTYGKNDQTLAKYQWDINVLQVQSLRQQQPGEGITISVTTPKNFFKPYVAGFWEKFGSYFYVLIPLLVLILCFLLWQRYGKDPRISWTIAPEFEIPEDLSPIDYGLVVSDGTLKTQYLTAGIVNLAVKKHLKIYQSSEPTLLNSGDYELELLTGSKEKLSKSEQVLIDGLFDGSKSVKLSSLKNKFYANIPKIETAGIEYLESNKWVAGSSKIWMGGFLAFGLVMLFTGFILFSYDNILALCIIASGIIILIFSPLMRHRTKEGALLLRRLKGFELYLRKAEKYRQQWLERQSVFETFLPYAIIYGITGEWIKKLRDIYGEKYFTAYHPIWYYGYSGNFNIDSLTSNIDHMSHTMASTLSSSPSSSGAGGCGFSGGGGGGGGGGGW